MHQATSAAANVPAGPAATRGGEPPGARRRAVGLFAFFFLVIAAFWIQKPIRTSKLLIDVGPQALPLVKLGTALSDPAGDAGLLEPRCPLPASDAGLLVHGDLRLDLARSSGGCCAPTARGGRRGRPYAFFFYVDIFNSVLVALFWSFANDLTTPDEARRDLRPGRRRRHRRRRRRQRRDRLDASSASAPPNLLLVCIALLAAIAALARVAGARCATGGRPRGAGGDVARGGRRCAADGRARRICCRSPAWCSPTRSSPTSSTISSTPWSRGRYTAAAAMAGFLGRFSTASSAASLLVQLGLTSWILRRWGPRVGLLVLPLVLGLGSLGFLVQPLFVGHRRHLLRRRGPRLLAQPDDQGSALHADRRGHQVPGQGVHRHVPDAPGEGGELAADPRLHGVVAAGQRRRAPPRRHQPGHRGARGCWWRCAPVAPSSARRRAGAATRPAAAQRCRGGRGAGTRRAATSMTSLAARVRPGERRELAAALGTAFLVMLAHAQLETARDTLFLTNVAADADCRGSIWRSRCWRCSADRSSVARGASGSTAAPWWRCRSSPRSAPRPSCCRGTRSGRCSTRSTSGAAWRRPSSSPVSG